ncbi:hypothetical protein Cylst_4111 [Cylindrospermum stagnale PCC 7417]|uniref:Uncharacterized protein n=1 Tax=Cylindrospermum stagnale PCC 7417 TaxID=56107 RepID=K9X3D7_9NOST|nr:hypothetical protein [Cylindrospermum stagnale]AFZ26217.1 hypothetical protein Cylst_4111 [Cylindrospermum stagnale PCC 7417]
MEQDPTYIIWHPSLKQKDEFSSIITFNITPIATLDFPTEPKEFYIQLLADIGIDIEPKSWDIVAYRSNYYRDLESQDWQDYWTKVWRVVINLNGHIDKLPKISEEDIETYAYALDSQCNENNNQKEIGCIIIADFQSKTSAEKAKVAVQNSEKIQQLAQDISAPVPELYNLEIGENFYQIQIVLGTFPESFFINGAAYALAIENICNQLGGITSFDERVNEWGEI